ncbi:Uncharacterised protein [Mycobacteroides abscessus subsp. abscessus]|nr:Uncharacterised protein [Mycobacteroides abscessus subsp. abscessus]
MTSIFTVWSVSAVVTTVPDAATWVNRSSRASSQCTAAGSPAPEPGSASSETVTRVQITPRRP